MAHQRYLRVKEIIEELTGNFSADADWYDEHYALIEYYKENLGCYADLHQDITEPHFRHKCQALEDISNHLIKEYKTMKWFSRWDYLEFNCSILYIADYVGDLNGGEDELCDLFDKFSCGKAN
jgi:hypothetical protein